MIPSRGSTSPFARAADLLDPPPVPEAEWYRENDGYLRPRHDLVADERRWYFDEATQLWWVRDRARPKQRPPAGEWLTWLLKTGRGFGKLLCVDTPIPTPDGWRRIGDLKIGSRVFDESGMPCRVTALFDEYPERAFRLTFSDGSTLIAGGEHQWVTWDHSARKAWNRSVARDAPLPIGWPAWRSGRGCGPSVRTTDEIAASLSQGKRADRNHSIPTCESLLIDERSLPLDPWLLGFWLGDGSTSAAALTCGESDIPWLCGRLDAVGVWWARYGRNTGRAPTIGLRNVKVILRDRLFVLGDKRIPEEYLWSSRSQRTELLRGLMDSDGYCSLQNGSVEFCSTLRVLADGVLQLARSLGERPTFSESRATLRGRDISAKFRVTWRPTRGNPFSLPRKASRVHLLGQQASRLFHRMIIGCDSVPLRPMRCITVDSPNSLYLAGEAMIPTHNTRSETEWVDYRARRKRYGEQILVAGRTPSDVRDYVIEGPGGFLRHHPDITWEPGNRVLRWPNGVVGLVRSGANPEEFRGYSGDTALLDEFAAWKYPEAAWNNMLFGLREGQDPRVVVGSTPRAIEILKRIVASDSTVTVSGSSLENRSNLAERYVRDVLDPLAGTRLGRQEIEGELLGDTPGALWTLDLIEQYRWPQGRAVPPLVRVVTGVDPQGVKDTDVDSDPAAADGRGRPAHETGIVVAGIDAAGELYVLEDASVNGRPIEWGRAAVRAHRKHGGDRIVAERNYGGDMVESTIRVVDANAPVTLVNASRGKIPRAEPIATLYERGRVHHVGMFKELEDEMCTYVPGGKSPNRMDALVWTCTELSAPSDDKEATVRVLRTAYRR